VVVGVDAFVVLSVCVVDGSFDGVCATARPVTVSIENSAAAANVFVIMLPS
jgi:hypothetical protein